MKKVAKIIYASFLSRVIVDENATREDIVNKGRENVRSRLDLDYPDNIEYIKDDVECPFGTFDTDEAA